MKNTIETEKINRLIYEHEKLHEELKSISQECIEEMSWYVKVAMLNSRMKELAELINRMMNIDN